MLSSVHGPAARSFSDAKLSMREVVSAAAIDGVHRQHAEHYTHVMCLAALPVPLRWDENHGQAQQASVEDGGCSAQLVGRRTTTLTDPHLGDAKQTKSSRQAAAGLKNFAWSTGKPVGRPRELWKIQETQPHPGEKGVSR